MQDLGEHFEAVVEGADGVLADDAVNLVFQLETLVKHVGADELEFVGDAFLLQNSLGTFYHALRDIEAIDLACTELNQLLAARTEATADFEESPALDSLLDHLLEHGVVGVMLH